MRNYASKYSELLSIPTVESTFLAYALKAKGVLSQDDEEQIKARFEHYADSGMVPYHGKRFFVDTIGMICPFLYTCGMDDLADRQISGYDSALYAGVFPFHSYDFERKLPLGVCDWARGTGWYILGLLGSDHNRVRILKLADNMLRLQRRDGGFGCFLFNPESHIESSGSAVAGLLFERAYRLSGETQYLLAAKKVEKALMGMTRRDGSLDYAQGDTSGAGMYSDRFDILPFAQGMTLLLVERLDTYNKHE
ncbi:MAG: glycoside hydrolase family 88 protein [Bacteroidales bacterium]|nr:glycoside hydrolase family 88 protein [Bacteroidales bacterium]